MTSKFENSLQAIEKPPGFSSKQEERHPLTIVCVSDLFWDEHWASEQQIMSRLAARCCVLYVDRPVSIFSFFTGVSDSSVTRQWLRWLHGGLRQVNQNLTILTPAPLLPFRYNRLINRINSWIRRLSIKRAVRKMKFDAPVLWIYAPDAAGIVGTLDEAYSLYYCADDWSASYHWWNSGQDIRAREMELASKVDLVVGTSTKIVQRWQQSHPNTMLVANGADVTAFQAARDPELEIPEDLKVIPTPRIGYVGYVDARFDTELYARLAQARPDWYFVVVGPLMEKHVDLSRLKQLSNVHFLGRRSLSELPMYLKGFDVCTIPYICDKLAESIFPLKLFEYLAAGRPIVSTDLPELRKFSKYLHLTHGLAEFEKAIAASLTHPLPIASQNFLAENSWDARASLLHDTLLSQPKEQ